MFNQNKKTQRIDDMRSENESNEMDNIPQFPNMNVDYFFTRAFNSFGVIKGEQFQVQQNDESDDSDSDLTQIVKTLRDEFDEIDDFENTVQHDTQTETETQHISNTQVYQNQTQVVNITPTNNTSNSGTDDCMMEHQFPKIGSGNYFPTWLFNDMVPEEVNQLPADITGQKLYTVTGANNDN